MRRGTRGGGAGRRCSCTGKTSRTARPPRPGRTPPSLPAAVAEMIRPSERGYDFETAFLVAALAGGVRVRSVPVGTIYEGQHSHFRHWEDTWRLAGVFTRYSRQIIFGAR